nr:reverse transcriptase domain-containing protein [Tanacetum cinerariifolium]
MSTRSSAKNLFSPLDNPDLTIRRRSHTDPTLLNDFEMATDENGDPPVPDLRTMEELCQPTLNGRGGPIAPIAIQAMNFRLKNDMIQQVQNSCQFHRSPGDDANKHLDKFLHVTQNIKVNRVTDDALRLYLFPHSLTHHATAWFDRFPRKSITTFEQMAKMFLGKYFPPSMVTKLRNEITNFCQRPDESLFEAWEHYKLSIDRCPNHNMLPVTQIDTFYNGLTLRHRDTINAAASGTFMKRHPEECYDLIENMTAHHNDWDTSAQRILQINQQVKAVTPSCETCGGPHSYNDYPATVGQTQNVYATRAYNQGGLGTLLSNTITNPNEDLKGITTRSGNAYQGPTIPTTYSSLPKVVKRETEVTKETMPLTNNRSPKNVQPSPNQKPLIPYPSRLHDQKLRDKANDQKEKFVQIFQDLNLNISFADALILMPKFGPTIKSLLTNKDKQFELARTSLNEHCSAVLLKKLLEKLRDPGKFLIPCDFPGMDECLALADLGASINITPLSVVAEDVFVKVGKFHFSADFVVVDFDADPRVSLILERLFLKIGRALIDVYAEELTLRVNNEAVTFNLDQTSRYLANYNDMTENQIDVIDMDYEEYSQEVLSFSNVITSGNPTLYYDPIVSSSSSTLTPFRYSDFLLEEVDPFLALEDDPTSLDSSIDEPPEVELKDLPPHLEYAFLEGDDQSPVIIAKYLSVEEKAALIKVLKSHKRAIAWKLSDIKGINPKFYTHKILMEDDFKPVVQHQRRVNPKIYDVIKKEVKKLLDAGLIYPISDSPWEKSHLMVKEGIVLGHKISKNRIEVDKVKVDVIAKLPHPTTVKGIRSFLDHVGFYRRFIQDFLKIARPMTRLFKKYTPFFFSKECIEAFQTLKRKLTKELILIAPDWDLPFELMCDASDFAIDAVLGFQGETAPVGSPPSRVQIQRPFPSSRGNVYILVAIDYLSKWVEAKALPTNDARVVCKFLKSLFAMFGTPRAIISDRGTHFSNDQSAKVMLKYGVTHPFKTPIGCTPYKLVYKKACHLPIELEHKAYWTLKHCNYDLLTMGDCHKVQLNELNDLRDQAYENYFIYKEKTKRIHDSKIQDRVFNVGDRVLFFYSRLKIFSSKLKTRWSRPFTITQVFPYGTVELSQTDGPNFKVMVIDSNTTFERTYQRWLSWISKPFPRTNEFGDWVKLSDTKQALHGTPCLS